MVMTTAARLGGKLLAVSSPRGGEAWNQNRKDTHDSFDVTKEAAAAMRHKVVTMFGSVQSINEPFACLIHKTLFSPHGIYPAGTAKTYSVALKAYLAPHLRCDLYQVLDAPIDRKVAYRNKKRPATRGSEALYGESSSAQ
ncbi:unnamed protein product [Nippostrongylus brasiliensis]|uniref:Short chain dehydrogenase n=1 Tax=Nippostrongylus brasiliensis TaxID=27835 RepID=A0A0N4YDC0_NIPBR|nr:unnamed protein product [Nippostrongylus brasiliensis]